VIDEFVRLDPLAHAPNALEVLWRKHIVNDECHENRVAHSEGLSHPIEIPVILVVLDEDALDAGIDDQAGRTGPKIDD